MFQGKPVGAVFLKLFVGKGNHARLEPGRQTDDHVDIAVPTETSVVLVGPLEEHLVLELRQPLVGQRLSDGHMHCSGSFGSRGCLVLPFLLLHLLGSGYEGVAIPSPVSVLWLTRSARRSRLIRVA